jgi:hypothetical protein
MDFPLRLACGCLAAVVELDYQILEKPPRSANTPSDDQDRHTASTLSLAAIRELKG